MLWTKGKDRRRGFTLIEIMIVVLIIAILLAIAIPNFLRARESARAKSCQGNMRQIQNAKEQWAMDNKKVGTDTPTATNLVTDYVKGSVGVLPGCPSNGTYTIGNVATKPTCSIATNGDADPYNDHVTP